MTLPIKSGLLVAATSALLAASPFAQASAAPLGVAPAALVRAELPIDNVGYRRHAAPRRHYVRHRYYRRHYRYGYNPGLAIFGTALGAIAAAGAYDYYDPGYYPYAYPAYGYGYPAYGWGWGGGPVFHGGHWRHW